MKKIVNIVIGFTIIIITIGIITSIVTDMTSPAVIEKSFSNTVIDDVPPIYGFDNGLFSSISEHILWDDTTDTSINLVRVTINGIEEEEPIFYITTGLNYSSTSGTHDITLIDVDNTFRSNVYVPNNGDIWVFYYTEIQTPQVSTTLASLLLLLPLIVTGYALYLFIDNKYLNKID